MQYLHAVFRSNLTNSDICRIPTRNIHYQAWNPTTIPKATPNRYAFFGFLGLDGVTILVVWSSENAVDPGWAHVSVLFRFVPLARQPAKVKLKNVNFPKLCSFPAQFWLSTRLSLWTSHQSLQDFRDRRNERKNIYRQTVLRKTLQNNFLRLKFHQFKWFSATTTKKSTKNSTSCITDFWKKPQQNQMFFFLPKRSRKPPRDPAHTEFLLSFFSFILPWLCCFFLFTPLRPGFSLHALICSSLCSFLPSLLPVVISL